MVCESGMEWWFIGRVSRYFADEVSSKLTLLER
jgi:hypothetical protein